MAARVLTPASDRLPVLVDVHDRFQAGVVVVVGRVSRPALGRCGGGGWLS